MGRRVALWEVPDATRITSFVVLDAAQGKLAYGVDGVNGVVEITSKGADDYSKAFSLEQRLETKGATWFRGVNLHALPGGGAGFGGSLSGKYIPDEDMQLLEQGARPSVSFSGDMTLNPDGEGRLSVALNGRGDAMMGALGVIRVGQVNSVWRQGQVDTAQISRFFNMLLALSGNPDALGKSDPRPLCLIDGNRLVATEQLPDATRIAGFTAFDKPLAEQLYGAEGRNGAVVVTTKREGEPSALLEAEINRPLDKQKDLTRISYRGEGMGFVGKNMLTGGSFVPGGKMLSEAERKQYDEWVDDMPEEKIPAEQGFEGAIATQYVKGSDIAIFTVYGVNDTMMMAASQIIPMRGDETSEYLSVGVTSYGPSVETELARIVYRLSRGATAFPGLMAEPMPLCLVDGVKVKSYDDVPSSEQIAEMTVLSKKRGMATYGSEGMNGVVRIVSTRVMKTSPELIKSVSAKTSAHVMSCMPADGKLDPASGGFFAQMGGLVGGIGKDADEPNDWDNKKTAYVVDGELVSGKKASKLRPSTFKRIAYISDMDEIACYVKNAEEYSSMVKIEILPRPEMKLGATGKLSMVFVGGMTILGEDGKLSYVENAEHGARIEMTHYNPLIVVDGVVVPRKYIDTMNRKNIESMETVRTAEALAEFGEQAKGHNCVLYIVTKAAAKSQK